MSGWVWKAPAGSQTEGAGCRWQAEVAWVPAASQVQAASTALMSQQAQVLATSSSSIKQAQRADRTACCYAAHGHDGTLGCEGHGQVAAGQSAAAVPAKMQAAATQTRSKSCQQQRNQAITGRMQLQDKVADLLMVAGALLAGHPPGRLMTVLAEKSRPRKAITYRHVASTA